MRLERGNMWDERRTATARRLFAAGYTREVVATRWNQPLGAQRGGRPVRPRARGGTTNEPTG